jgi:hypothetical protein
MIRQTLILLGVGFAVTGLAPLAYGQSVRPADSTDDSVTLSGESLQTIEGRTAETDSQRFFDEAPSATLTGTDGAGMGGSQPPSLQISDRLEVVVGDTLDSRDTFYLFPPSDEAGEPQRAKLQFELGN